MNKNMRYVLKAVVVGALVLIAVRLFAKRTEGFASNCKKPDSKTHKCPNGYFCPKEDKKCECCKPLESGKDKKAAKK